MKKRAHTMGNQEKAILLDIFGLQTECTLRHLVFFKIMTAKKIRQKCIKRVTRQKWQNHQIILGMTTFLRLRAKRRFMYFL